MNTIPIYKVLNILLENIDAESHHPSIKILKKNKKSLTSKEREICLKQKVIWHFGNREKPVAAIWKSVVRNKTYYVSNTHRCYAVRSNLKSAIAAFFDIVKPSA
jgi:hypothetical protein